MEKSGIRIQDLRLLQSRTDGGAKAVHGGGLENDVPTDLLNQRNTDTQCRTLMAPGLIPVMFILP